MTLIELLVAMGLFTILLGVFMSGIAAMTRSPSGRGRPPTRATRSAGPTSGWTSRSATRLRSTGRAWWLASSTSSSGRPRSDGGNATCTQYRLNGPTDKLELPHVVRRHRRHRVLLDRRRQPGDEQPDDRAGLHVLSRRTGTTTSSGWRCS